MAVLHIILSHHGKLEHGSPVVPCTREATLVHMIDNLGGTLGSFDRLEKTLRDGERWSAFDRGISELRLLRPAEAAAGRARSGLDPANSGEPGRARYRAASLLILEAPWPRTPRSSSGSCR